MIEGNEEGSDERALTAMGILNTIETILTVMEDHKEVRIGIEIEIVDVDFSVHLLYRTGYMIRLRQRNLSVCWMLFPLDGGGRMRRRNNL